ncbi:peroxidase-like protein 3 isoform X2 [Patella vulgata]|nr:peroxidase-like protein 3 isoform X2 [Patella vulgata]
MLMQWGQFLDHDFTAAAIRQPEEEDACCNHTDVMAGNLHPDSFTSDGQCFPIPIVQDPSDRHFNRTCMNFVRSKSIDEHISFFRPREQQNLLTAFIDGSNVYGSDDTTASHLRGQNGRMKTSGNNLLPRGNDADCIRDNAPYCFAAGDERVHVFPGLTAMHTAFVRLHNYIVEKLDTHTNWDGEKLYQETRKIIGGLLQRITYTEFLPEILNNYTMHKYRLVEGGYQYNPNVNPSISNVFGTAAFRFGHSLIPDFLVIDGQEVPSRKLFNNPQYVFTSLDSIVANLLSSPAQMRDRFVTREVLDHLFERNGIGFDLPAFNIQRGRDHGLPSYNMFRYFCGLPEVTAFNSSHLGNAGPSLQEVYAHVNDIDVFAGGLSEPNLPGSNLGPLFSCIVAQQFEDLKYGDSFWYERLGQQRGFSASELASIKQISLSKILCQVFNLVKVQRNPFKFVTTTNPEVLCDSLDEIDLTPWYLN